MTRFQLCHLLFHGGAKLECPRNLLELSRPLNVCRMYIRQMLTCAFHSATSFPFVTTVAYLYVFLALICLYSVFWPFYLL